MRGHLGNLSERSTYPHGSKHTFGKENPNACARRVPSLQSPPPTLLPFLSYQLPGLPIISHTLQTWSTSLPPGKRGFRLAISTAIAPIAHISTGEEYWPARRSTSGARYHLVDTYVVYGFRECVSRASPKSAILTVYRGGVLGGVTNDEYRRRFIPVSWGAEDDTKMFSGLMSRWKKLWVWMWSRPERIWYRMLLTLPLSKCLWSLAFMSWYRLPSMYSIHIWSFLVMGSRKISRAGTRWAWFGRERRKMTSRSSKHGWNESNVFFIVLIATLNTISLNPHTSQPITYHATSPRDMSTGRPNTSQRYAPKATIADIFQNLEFVFETAGSHQSIRRFSSCGILWDRHLAQCVFKDQTKFSRRRPPKI